MSWKKLWDAMAGFLSGEAASILEEAEKTMDKTIDNMEKKIEVVTVKAIKASAVFLLIFVGLIFGLVGLSNYLTEAWQLKDGMGQIIVGAVLLLLGWFAKLVR